MLVEEKFRFDDYYEVSTLGEVFSLDREVPFGRNRTRFVNGSKLKPHQTGRGLQVHCHLSTGEDVYLSLAKLVYYAFCTDRSRTATNFLQDFLNFAESEVIVHIDGNMDNNRVDNLSLESKATVFMTSIENYKKRLEEKGIQYNAGQTKYLREKKDTAVNDEYYTPYEVIDNELKCYSTLFKDKVVYCNCDSPDSKFVKYFENNFSSLGLKKFISSCISDNDNEAIKVEITEQGKEVSVLENGSFESDECIELLKEADIVVTNPPFSLIRKYIPLLLKYEKDFIILAPLWCAGYKEIFPYIMNRKILVGRNNKNIKFFTPTDNKRVVPTVWLSTYENFYTPPLELKYNYTPEKYPTFENCDIIEVNSTERIPCDYFGVMAVPLSFLPKWNKDQFELVEPPRKQLYYIRNGETKKPFSRVFIRRKVNNE